MKIILSIGSIIVLILAFLFLMSKQDNIPLSLQITSSVLLIAYEIFILIKINKEVE